MSKKFNIDAGFLLITIMPEHLIKFEIRKTFFKKKFRIIIKHSAGWSGYYDYSFTTTFSRAIRIKHKVEKILAENQA